MEVTVTRAQLRRAMGEHFRSAMHSRGTTFSLSVWHDRGKERVDVMVETTAGYGRHGDLYIYAEDKPRLIALWGRLAAKVGW
jgi:hypothetical protein